MVFNVFMRTHNCTTFCCTIVMADYVTLLCSAFVRSFIRPRCRRRSRAILPAKSQEEWCFLSLPCCPSSIHLLYHNVILLCNYNGIVLCCEPTHNLLKQICHLRSSGFPFLCVKLPVARRSLDLAQELGVKIGKVHGLCISTREANIF